MSKKRKQIPMAILRQFTMLGCNGVKMPVKVTGHIRNQKHKADPNLPEWFAEVPVCVCGKCGE